MDPIPPTTTTIDYSAFPHIVERVVDYAPHEVLLSLRLVSKDLQRQADTLLFKHIMIRTPVDTDHLVAANGENLPGEPWHLVPPKSAGEQLWHKRLGNTRIVDDTSFQKRDVQRIKRGCGPPLPPQMESPPPIPVFHHQLIFSQEIVDEAAAFFEQLSPQAADMLHELSDSICRRAQMEERIINDLSNGQVCRHVPGTAFRSLEIEAPHLITFVPCTPCNLEYPTLRVHPPHRTTKWTITVLWHPTQFSLWGTNFQPCLSGPNHIEEIVLLVHQLESPIFPASDSLPDREATARHFADAVGSTLAAIVSHYPDTHYQPKITVVGFMLAFETIGSAQLPSPNASRELTRQLKDFAMVFKTVEEYRSSVSSERFDLETNVNPEMFHQFVNEVVYRDLVRFA